VVCDHFLSGPAGRPAEAFHEGWTILAALAASTGTIELGQLVMCVSFRSPALLAKMAVTADGVSSDRLVSGLGAGWCDREYLALGFPAGHRVASFEEALQVIGPLLRGERLTFAGRYPPGPRRGAAAGAGPADPDPGDRQPPADAAADRTLRRCLEHGLVRATQQAAEPAAGRHGRGAAGRKPRPGHAAPDRRHGLRDG